MSLVQQVLTVHRKGSKSLAGCNQYLSIADQLNQVLYLLLGLIALFKKAEHKKMFAMTIYTK